MPIIGDFPMREKTNLHTVTSNSLSNYNYSITDSGIMIPKLDSTYDDKYSFSQTINTSKGNELTVQVNTTCCEYDDVYKAFDRSDSTGSFFGDSAYVTDDAYLRLHFSEKVKVNKVYVRANMKDVNSNYACSLSLQISDDDEDGYTTLKTKALYDESVWAETVSFTNSALRSYFRIYRGMTNNNYNNFYVYTLNILEWEYSPVSKKRNALTSSSLNVNGLYSGQVITIKTNSYSIDNLNDNTLNGKSIDEILLPNKIYSLVWDGTKFVCLNKDLSETKRGVIRENGKLYFDKYPKCAFGTLSGSTDIMNFPIDGHYVKNPNDLEATVTVLL